MKTQTWGVASHVPSVTTKTMAVMMAANATRKRALNDYIERRANGKALEDSPSRPFPADGQYTWETPTEWAKRVRYDEGLGDRAWMEEKDQKYLARLEREGTLREQEPEVWEQRYGQLQEHEKERIRVEEEKRRAERERLEREQHEKEAEERRDQGCCRLL